MRRRRLTAPTLSGPGVGIDPNTVAEYLDNTLPPDGVAGRRENLPRIRRAPGGGRGVSSDSYAGSGEPVGHIAADARTDVRFGPHGGRKWRSIPPRVFPTPQVRTAFRTARWERSSRRLPAPLRGRRPKPSRAPVTIRNICAPALEFQTPDRIHRGGRGRHLMGDSDDQGLPLLQSEESGRDCAGNLVADNGNNKQSADDGVPPQQEGAVIADGAGERVILNGSAEEAINSRAEPPPVRRRWRRSTSPRGGIRG